MSVTVKNEGAATFRLAVGGVTVPIKPGKAAPIGFAEIEPAERARLKKLGATFSDEKPKGRSKPDPSVEDE